MSQTTIGIAAAVLAVVRGPAWAICCNQSRNGQGLVHGARLTLHLQH